MPPFAVLVLSALEHNLSPSLLGPPMCFVILLLILWPIIPYQYCEYKVRVFKTWNTFWSISTKTN